MKLPIAIICKRAEIIKTADDAIAPETITSFELALTSAKAANNNDAKAPIKTNWPDLNIFEPCWNKPIANTRNALNTRAN